MSGATATQVPVAPLPSAFMPPEPSTTPIDLGIKIPSYAFGIITSCVIAGSLLLAVSIILWFKHIRPYLRRRQVIKLGKKADIESLKANADLKFLEFPGKPLKKTSSAKSFGSESTSPKSPHLFKEDSLNDSYYPKTLRNTCKY